MRLKEVNPRFLVHLFCIAAIVCLSAFIYIEKINDHDNAIQSEWQSAMQSNFIEIKGFNGYILKEIENSVEDYINPNNLKYGNRAKNAISKTDSILALLDSLQRKPNNNLVCETQGKLSVFYSELWKYMDFDTFSIENRSKFKPTDWLYKSWKNDSKSQFHTILDETKLKVLLNQKDVLIYIERKTSSEHSGWDRFETLISFDQLNPKVGELVTANVFLSEDKVKKNISYKLNGKELQLRGRNGQFQVKYDKSGLYPLLFSVEKTNPENDSISTWQKTYYLRVL
jgi:hypothetical protein